MMAVGRLRKIRHGQVMVRAMIVAVARYLLHASRPSLTAMLGHVSKASPLVAALSVAAVMVRLLWLLAAHLVVASLCCLGFLRYLHLWWYLFMHLLGLLLLGILRLFRLFMSQCRGFMHLPGLLLLGIMRLFRLFINQLHWIVHQLIWMDLEKFLLLL